MIAKSAVLVWLLASACSAPQSSIPRTLQDDTPIGGEGARVLVAGLSCPQCASNIDLTLGKLPGVRQVVVDLGSGVVDIDFDEQQSPSKRAIAQAIVDSGFTILTIDGK